MTMKSGALCVRWALALVLVAMPARAQDRAELWRQCEGAACQPAAARVTACTSLIESGGESDQSLAVLRYARANARRALQHDAAAIADYDEAIRLNPFFTSAYRRRGDFHRVMRAYDRALRDFDQAVRLDPSADHHLGRGMLRLSIGDPTRALEDFAVVIRLHPRAPEAYYGRSRAYRDLAMPERGDEALHEAHQRDGGRWLGACERSMGLGFLGNAQEDCDEAVRLQPDHEHARSVTGRLHLRFGRIEAAIADLDAALRQRPCERATRLERAIANLIAGHLDAVVVDCDAYLRMQSGLPTNPEIAMALYTRGLARQRRGDGQGGAEDIAQARRAFSRVAQVLAGFGVK